MLRFRRGKPLDIEDGNWPIGANTISTIHVLALHFNNEVIMLIFNNKKMIRVYSKWSKIMMHQIIC